MNFCHQDFLVPRTHTNISIQCRRNKRRGTHLIVWRGLKSQLKKWRSGEALGLEVSIRGLIATFDEELPSQQVHRRFALRVCERVVSLCCCCWCDVAGDCENVFLFLFLDVGGYGGDGVVCVVFVVPVCYFCWWGKNIFYCCWFQLFFFYSCLLLVHNT